MSPRDLRPRLGGAILGVIALHLALQPLGLAPRGDVPDLLAAAAGFAMACALLGRPSRPHAKDA